MGNRVALEMDNKNLLSKVLELIEYRPKYLQSSLYVPSRDLLIYL